MADDDIVVSIELEGADSVAAQLDALGAKAKAALDPLNKSSAEAGGEGVGLVSRLFGNNQTPGSLSTVAAPVIAGAAAVGIAEEEKRAAAARTAARAAATTTVAGAAVGEGALLATEERPIPISSVVAQTLKALGVGGAVATVAGAAEPAAAGLITKIASVGTSVAGGITTAAPALTAAVAAAGPALTAAVAAGHPTAVPRALAPTPEEPSAPGPEPAEPREGRSIFGGSRRIPVSIVVREALSALGIRFPGAGLVAHVGVEAAEQGGALGAFAAGGVGALAVGGILAGLASVEDRAKKTRQTLDQVFAPQSGGGLGGQGANERVRGLAERFGTEPETFATPLANLVRGQRQVGAQIPEAINEKAITSLYEAIRSGGASTEEAGKALADFTADVEKTGHVSADAVRSLEELSQRGADALARSFGRINADRLIQDINRGLTIPIGELAPRLAAFETQNRKTFDNAVKDVDTYHTTFSKFTSDLNRDVEKIAGEGADRLLQRVISATGKWFNEATQTAVAFKNLVNNPGINTASDFLSKWVLGRYEKEPTQAETATRETHVRTVPKTEEERETIERRAGIRVTHPAERKEAAVTQGFPEKGYYYTGAGELLPVPPAVAEPHALELVPNTQPLPPANLPGLTTGAPLGGVTQPVGSAPIPSQALPPVPPPSEAINAALNSIAGPAQGAGAGLQSVATSAPQVGTAFSTIAGAIAQISAAINAAIAGIAAAATPPANTGSSAPVEPGGATGGLFTGLDFMRFAPGGHVGGVGTGKSDSNLALLSRGEYVHQQPAVAHYGVGFMHAINNMTFPKFSLGGLMDGISSSMNADIPRFAGGGLATVSSSAAGSSPGSVVNLHFPDRSFSNLRTSSKTAEDLRNYSLGRQVASTGTRPSWDGG